MKVLLLAPFYDRSIPGESWSTYKWVEGISANCETVVLTQHPRGWDPAGSPTAAVQTVNWTDPNLPLLKGRVLWELKPTYAVFYRRARAWMRALGPELQRFDLIHQINPLALRYPCPARGLGVPYVMGPLAGSLPTPGPLAAAAKEKLWFRRLRTLDRVRFRWDPWLRSSYAGASALLGVAPYIRDVLGSIPLRRFEVMAETGVESVVPEPKSSPAAGEPLRLLFVGRLIRTKGILEAIHAVAAAAKIQRVTFDIVGTGDLEQACQSAIAEHGAGGFIRLHGRRPKQEVFEWYDRSHVFLFPSFREPSGNVVFEAMSRGLPVIGSSVGGPGYVITDDCGFRVAPSAPAPYASALADCIVQIAREPSRVTSMSAAALERARQTALWPGKVSRLLNLYEDLRRPATEITH